MTVDRHELYVTRTSSSVAPAEGALARFRRNLAPQDYVVFSYLCFLNVAVLSSPAGATRTHCLANVLGLLALHVATLVAIRGKWLTQPITAGLLYRVVTYGCVQITYFMFADLLPLVNPRTLDHKLYELDLTLFGVEPAVYFDRFVTDATTEWFAFFYFGYFFLLAIHVLPILFASRNARMMSEFAMGMILMFCIGHTLYVFVPGYGPYKAMPQVFEHPLSQGIWWNTTRTLVAQSGAQKDIFPSLHTAAPTFLLLFSFHRRAELPFRYSWPFVAFFAANIVIATMFLRWHYVIDVVFGLLLAVTAHTLAVRLTERDTARRDALGLGPSWPQWPGGAA